MYFNFMSVMICLVKSAVYLPLAVSYTQDPAQK